MKRIFLAVFMLGLSLQAKEQLKIVADAFHGSEKNNRTVFEGNVHIKKGSDELNASKVEVLLDDERQPVKYTADGDVSFFLKTEDNSTYRGVAQKVIFMPLEQEYRFYKNVRLLQINEHKQIDGDEVIVNIKNGTATARGADKKPVIMIFDLPEKKKTP